ncbi:MAG: NAD-dependent epimerase, partial [Actinomycetota bacterium]|nr:NAD-dependent epimerase [Actinomycetota bacterium]
ELGWEPSHSSLEAVGEMLEGMREGAGMNTPPLQPQAGGKLREKEVATGVGERPGVEPDQGK